MKENILKILKEKEDSISGEELSKKFGVSRTAIWKNINSLREEGYEIESVQRKGYRLISNPDKLSKKEILPELNTDFIGKEYIYLEEIDSTNEEVKRRNLSMKDGAVIVTEHQTKGKGRLGRKWYSPKKQGIYFSIILRPEIPPFEAPKITQIAAAALINTLIKEGIEANIKWPNDIVIGNRKIAGILTEMSGQIMEIDYIVLGIGINTSIDYDYKIEEFEEKLAKKATSLAEYSKNISRKRILLSFLEDFEIYYKDFLAKNNIEKSLEICRKNSAIIGKKIKVIRRESEEYRKALDIDEEGRLLVMDEDGNIEKIVSGEVSIRGENSYI